MVGFESDVAGAQVHFSKKEQEEDDHRAVQEDLKEEEMEVGC